MILIYLTVPPTSSEVHWKAVHDGTIGVINTPIVGNTGVAEWPVWAADNGCFSQGGIFDGEEYMSWLVRWKQHAARCLFAAAPDVLGDAAATWERSEPLLQEIRGVGYRAAIVAQPGFLECGPDWDRFDCVFIGGDDEFKMGAEGTAIALEAQRRGKWVHCGRVNSFRRLEASAMRGDDSADGTFVAFAPDKNVRRVRVWLQKMRRQPTLDLWGTHVERFAANRGTSSSSPASSVGDASSAERTRAGSTSGGGGSATGVARGTTNTRSGFDDQEITEPQPQG